MERVTYLLTSYAALTFSIALSIIYARGLGIEDFGVLQTLFTVILVILPAANFKFDEILVRDAISQPKDIWPYLLAEYLVILGTLVAITLVWTILSPQLGIGENSFPIWILFFALFGFWPTSLDGLIRGFGKELQLQIAKTLSVLASLGVIAYEFLTAGLTLVNAFTIVTACRSIVLTYMICFYLSKRNLLTKSEARIDLANFFLEGLTAAVNNFLSIILKSASLLAAVFIGPTAVAILKVADSISQLTYFAASALLRFNFLNVMRYEIDQKISFGMPSILVLVNVAGAAAILPYALPAVYGEEFAEAYWPTLVLCLSYFLSSLVYTSPASSFKERGLGFQIYVKTTMVFVLVPATYVMAGAFGILGVAVAIAFSKAALMYIFHLSARGKSNENSI